ncbi:hypothetical protein [Acinetobacter colistiniresistens]|uniref:Uncharacterized protein n=4 Tax=Acinetobacter colistiniresistens TaxID=280145 RepID=S3T0K5_9GAMM|nr:hypothetical protein [Acinetobacter colistiniresistens]EPG34498.1 hypothetical protein F907_03415 [Acinetobacter colistiniresistens]TVT87630.1 hypothetical protein FPV60_00630 [Acinetobacter colistiniresistens]
MNIHTKSNKEIIRQITRIADNFEASQENYLLSYPHFLNYFKNIETIKLENIIIGISFTYSWMPTILKKLKLNNSEYLLSSLNDVKQGKRINEKQLLFLKKTFNNSLVGTSKLLHFINPHNYAIWDSRVLYFLSNQEPYTYRLENIQTYFEYLDLVEKLTKEQGFETFYTLIKQKMDYEITEFRALEFAFFLGIE